MKSTYQVKDLVPHSGEMSLLQRIVDHGDEWLVAEIEIGQDSLFADANGVPTWIGLEYMAQTIAAYAGLQERLVGKPPKIGFLLGTRKYSVNTDYFIPGDTLSIRAELEMIADNGLNVFKCDIQGKDTQATAIINVFQPDDAEKFLAEALA